MKAGKLSINQLKRSVLKQLNSEGANKSAYRDGASIDVKDDESVVFSTNPVSYSAGKIGSLGLIHAINNVSAMGAKAVGVMVSLMLPTSYDEVKLRALVKDIDQAAARENVAVLGGHTEVSRIVNEALVTVTGVGVVSSKEEKKLSGQISPGMDIVISKWIGLEGTYLLASEKEEELRSRYSAPFIDKAKGFYDYLSVASEAAVAVRSGVSYMHDVSNGGIFAGLWELAEEGHVGLTIDLKKIPIKQETVEITEFFDINPYKLMGGGALLMATNDGNALVMELEKAGIKGTIIGKITDSNDKVLVTEEEKRFLETSQTDELHKIFEI